MGLPVYDFRDDIRNVLVTPRIRSRFMQLEPGTVAEPHSHDLGHEVFIVMQGRAIFEIDGESAELSSGQMCVALADQIHGITVTSDEPMIMYLSVTPHILPTHTAWSEDGSRLPHTYGAPGAYDQEPDTEPIADLVSRLLRTATGTAEAGGAAAGIVGGHSDAFSRSVDRGDAEEARRIRGSLWEAISPVFRRADELAEVWNELASRAENS